MKIGLLLAGHTPEELRATRGDFDDMFEALLAGQGFDFASYDVENMAFPDDIRDCNGWLVTGSKHGAYEDHPFIPPLEAFIRAAYDAEIPMVGICFGHQIVAQALGGRVEKFAEGWAIGRREYLFADGRRLALNAWHQDQVTERPEGSRTAANNAFCENAFLVYGTRAFTMQPHPEFENDLLVDYISARRGTGVYPDEMMEAAIQAATQPIDNHAIAQAIGTFFRTGRADVPA